MVSFLGVISSCSPKTESDCGFVQNVYGQRISWKQQLPVDILISASVPSDLKSAIYRAGKTWESRLGKKVFSFSEEVLPATSASGMSQPGRDKKNGIYFLNNWESDKKSEQGRTSVYWAGDEIQEADIRINAIDFAYYNENLQQLVSGASRPYSTLKNSAGYSFEALILHEMGHFLGLKHKEDEGSVMATYLAAYANRTEPAAIDGQNVQCEYK